ncbi:MAG: nuclear transport factor 2 family protein [Acidobacteriota bacterium]|nr:nuclear transport factor 2 family protein [Acidobacteriota bacterium]
MNSILAAALLIAMLSLCNLADKTKTDGNSAPPTAEKQNTNSSEADREAVTVELMKLEYELTSASLNGDISALAPHIAENYVGTGADGTIQNKNQLLASTKRDNMTKSWKITDAQLVSLSNDSAVLSYIQQQTLRNGRTFRARITDTFVKRDGKWLVSAEQQTLIR